MVGRFQPHLVRFLFCPYALVCWFVLLFGWSVLVLVFGCWSGCSFGYVGLAFSFLPATAHLVEVHEWTKYKMQHG